MPGSLKALILGASGFIGSHLARALTGRAEVLGTCRQLSPRTDSCPLVSLDLRDGEAVKALTREFRPAIVIHLVAQPVVENVSVEQPAAWQTNVAVTSNVVAACRAGRPRLIFLSTDYVFDGTAGPYAEDAAPNPVNAYGRMKLAAEEIVRQSMLPHLILRTSLVYGWPAPHHHPNFAATVIDRLRRGQSFTAYADMIRTPIYVRDLTDVLVRLIERQAEGLYHIGSRDAASMYEFARRICDVFELDKDLIVAATSDAQADQAGVPRPKICGLRTDQAGADFKLVVPTILEGLHHMKEDE